MPRWFYYGWWVMLGCVVCQMDLGFAKDAMDVYMTYIVADFGWTRADFQLAGWFVLASYSVASPTVGYLLDRIGARAVLTLGALSLGLVFIAYSLMDSLTHYLAATLLLGFGLVAVGDIPASTVAARWFERNRGMVIGIVLVGSNIGAAIVNLMAKGLYRAFDDSWRPALVVLAVIMVVLVLPFTLFVIRDRNEDEVPEEERVAQENEPGGDATRASLGFRQALATRSLWVLVLALFAYYFYYLFVNRHIIALLRDNHSFGHTVPAPLVWLLGVRPEDFPELTKSLFEIVGIPAKLLAGYLVDRYRPRRALAWNFALLAAACFLFPLFDRSGAAIWVFILAHGAAWGAQQVLTPITLAQCFGLRHMGQIYGTLLLVLFPAHIGTWYAARIFDATGSYAGFFPYFMVLNIVGAAGLFFLREEGEGRRKSKVKSQKSKGKSSPPPAACE